MATSSRNPLVIAYHLMWTLYGWWLPNDPRGSTSRVIRNDCLSELGERHLGRKRIQPAGREIRTFYQQASEVLQHPLLSFESSEIATVAEAIGDAIQACNYMCYAAAIMPDHLHLVIRKHREAAEEMIEKVQTLSRERLIAVRVRDIGHPVWTRGGWKVFLDHPNDVWRTVRYVENNPVKQGLPIQHWPFVREYDNWPLHEGHSANSPYAKALKAAGMYSR